ncbi:hypothetical protein L1889_17465 [Paenalcaligenes niemegkensis]|uniref:hypothetical protein n=1 Tax=Paenalcaligenes niemegkensis TaxID=2895469 RepID=UPI001EE81FD4|nr:hypothetical protein [Paenalcaligenes niemegkensis]MCQ9618244.1 hypothetical protein [Paenalcaligenes niemegkensis]
MPLLTAIDEYDSAITTITIHARLGLTNSDPAQREAALRAILALCEKVDETVTDVLTYTTGAEQIEHYGMLK